MSEITKWKIYCNDEHSYITGYIPSEQGHPTTCFNNNQHTIDQTKSTVLEKIIKDHTPQLIKWKVYCDTEETYTYGYLESNQTVDFCFNNNEHIVSKRPTIEEVITNSNVRVVEETPLTGGNIKFKTFQFTVTGDDITPAPHIGSKTYFQSTLPNNISMISVLLMPTDKNVGDMIEADIGNHTTIGILTEDVASGITGGVTGYGVSQTVINYLQKGFHVTLTDGTYTDELGECVLIDRVTNKISTEKATIHSFAASTPTYVQQTVKFIETLYIVNNQNIVLGGDKIGASYVPAIAPGRIIYTNNDGMSKTFTFLITYLV